MQKGYLCTLTVIRRINGHGKTSRPLSFFASLLMRKRTLSAFVRKLTILWHMQRKYNFCDHSSQWKAPFCVESWLKIQFGQKYNTIQSVLQKLYPKKIPSNDQKKKAIMKMLDKNYKPDIHQNYYEDFPKDWNVKFLFNFQYLFNINKFHLIYLWNIVFCIFIEAYLNA